MKDSLRMSNNDKEQSIFLKRNNFEGGVESINLIECQETPF